MSGNLRLYDKPTFDKPRLVLGFSGWMDGGEVSTAPIRWLISQTQAKEFAEIEPSGFYLYSFPGVIELSGLVRPSVKIKDGLIQSLDFPSNLFFADMGNDVIYFLGREPQLHWESFANCIFSLCEEFSVEVIYFIGSVSSLVPHTREPRLLCTASNETLRNQFAHYGVKFADYEGPGGIATYLTAACGQLGLDMVTLVATIPAYIQGNNPKCIESMARRLAGMLNLNVPLEDLRELTDRFEKKVCELVEQQPDLANNILKLEEDYDNDIFDNELGDLKRWLQDQGLRID